MIVLAALSLRIAYVIGLAGDRYSPGPAGDSIYLTNNSSFQGALYATGNLDYSNNSYSDGPMVGSQILLSNNVTTQSFGTISTVPVGMPGNPEVYAQPNPPQRFSG